MPVLVFPANEIEKLGLYYSGYDDKRQDAALPETNLNRFRDSYGALPQSCSQMLRDIQAEDMGEFRILKPNVIHLLLCLCWLNTYHTESQMAGMFKVAENTVCKWCWKNAKAIQALKSKKVSNANNCLKNLYNHSNLETVCRPLYFSIVDCLALECKHSSTSLYISCECRWNSLSNQ
jgi:hypothetical protein